MYRIVAMLVLCVAPVLAQRDFLTADEADQLREAQKPDERLELYLTYARQRIDLLGQLFADNKPGRGVLIHDTLDQYTRIIEAIDTVTDDALTRQRPVTTLGKIAKTEREMLAQLQHFSALNTSDMERYRFSLDQAIDTTRDSAELADQDIGARAQQAAATEKREEAERKAASLPGKETAPGAAPAAPKKKASLLRPGETQLSDPRAADPKKDKARKKEDKAQ